MNKKIGVVGYKELKEFEKNKTVQLELFFLLEEEEQFSNTIELYDAIPKYLWARPKRESGKYLASLKRQFEHRGVRYNVRITPARLEDAQGNEKDYLPGQREELVEDVLRKLACEGRGVWLDEEAAVVFSLYEVGEELKQIGHGYKIQHIRDALLVCGKSNLEVSTEDGKSVVVGNIFTTVGLHTKEDWKNQGKDAKAFVRFNPLVTQCIKNKTFRQLNYTKCMSYKNALARWFHKRLSHNYIQADHLNSYTITLSTIIRDSGITRYSRLRDNVRDVKKALDELKKTQVLRSYKVDLIYDGQRKNKILDAKFHLFPHIPFVSEMKRANKRASEIQREAQIKHSSGRRSAPSTQRSLPLSEAPTNKEGSAERVGDIIGRLAGKMGVNRDFD